MNTGTSASATRCDSSDWFAAMSTNGTSAEPNVVLIAVTRLRSCCSRSSTCARVPLTSRWNAPASTIRYVDAERAHLHEAEFAIADRHRLRGAPAPAELHRVLKK